MKDVQTRTVRRIRLLGVTVMAIALILAALSTTAVAAESNARPDTSGHRAADRWIGDPTLMIVSIASGQETTEGHHYQVYLDEGPAIDREPAQYAGDTSIAANFFNHRFFTDETINVRVVGNYPENHRIEQLAD